MEFLREINHARGVRAPARLLPDFGRYGLSLSFSPSISAVLPSFCTSLSLLLRLSGGQILLEKKEIVSHPVIEVVLSLLSFMYSEEVANAIQRLFLYPGRLESAPRV